jgi:hypothetical protein
MPSSLLGCALYWLSLHLLTLSVSGFGTSVWTGRALQAGFDDLDDCLALLYPAREWSSVAPDHHGYPRAPDLILAEALKGR